MSSSRPRRFVRRASSPLPRIAAACEPLERRALLALAPAGLEFRVNGQTFQSQSAPAAASDGEGDVVVVWQSLGQDGSAESIYGRRYDANGVAQGGEFFVNNFTILDQSAPAVAADADGDFVVVWQSQVQDGQGFGIYAQRFDAGGRRRGLEFRVNEFTFNDQTAPSVAMDADGDFIVAWTTPVLDGSGLGVYARRFDAIGNARGGEFRVNTFTTGDQSAPDVAADAAGNFVVAWHSDAQDGSGAGVYARRFGAGGAALGGEFRVNEFTTNDQNLPSVASDLTGDFVVAWQSFAQDGSGAGIYARRYGAGGAALGGEFRANTATDANQTVPAVAADADGDFLVAWNSPDNAGSYGVFAQAFAASGAPRGAEFRANTFTTFDQFAPAVALDHEGDALVAWQSVGQDGGGSGVFAQRYDESPDTAGTTVTDVLIGESPVAPGERLAHRPLTLALLVSEPLSTAGGAGGVNSALNPANYLVTRNGAPVAIDFVTTGDPPVGKRNVVLVFPNLLPDGNYVVTARDALRDLAGNALDGNGDGAPGGDFTRAFTVAVPLPAGPEFRVNTTTAFDQRNAAVARDDDGDFVVVWASAERAFTGPGEGEEPPPYDIYAQRYSAAGVPQGPEFRVNVFTTGDQNLPDVAMDAAGNFVVTWSGLGPAGPGVDVHARRYDAAGNPLGNDFRVNTFTTSGQAAPSIAMDADGDFVVAWGSYYQDGAGAGVFAQRYAASGAPQGGELQVNSFTTGPQRSPDVAMNASGDYVVTWESFDQDGSSIGVFARVYDRNGTRMTNELPVNTFTTNTQSSAAVAADDEGNFVVTWVSRDQDGSSDGIYAKRFEATGAPRGGEFRVNTFTPGAQTGAAVDVDADGDFVVTWQTRPQGEADYNIYAQRYNAAGATQGDEFLVNTFTTSSQGGAVVATDADGDFVVAWGSNPQDGSGSGVYAQRFAAGASTAAPAVAASAFLFATAPQRLTFRFDQDVSASLGIPDLTVQQLPGGPTITPSTLSYDGTTNTATFTFGSVLPDGRYRATLSAAGITNASGTPLAADHVFTFHFLRGDANGDGAVNLLDFNRLAGNFGQSPRDFTQGDFNYDGTVNLQDFNLLAGRFGQSVAPAGAAPGWVGGRDDRSDELDDLLA